MNTIRFNNLGRVCLSSLAALCLLAATQARADDKDNRGQFTAKDYKFVTEATEGGTMEVGLSHLAADKSVNASVRDFANRMVTDHSKANDELAHLVAQKGAAPPEISQKKQEKMTERLGKLNGTEFDKAYMKDMLSDHKKTVKLFENESIAAEDPDLKAWVNKTLPTLQDHLRMAQSVYDGLASGPQANAAQ